MKKFLVRFFWIILAVTPLAAAEGSYSIYVFSQGVPQSGYEVEVDNTQQFVTDEHGEVRFSVEEGIHTVTVKKAGVIQGTGKVKVIGRESGFMVVNVKESGLEITKEEAEGDLISPEEKARLEAVKNKPKGFLAGTILSSEDKKPVEGARIFVKGLAVDGTTNGNGQFTLEMAEGNYSISIIHPNYSTQTITDIVILSKETTVKSFEVNPAGLQLEEFVVLAPHIEGSVASLIAEAKESNAIADVLGSEQMSKRGDSDAAGALKRVTGLTLVGGKNIYIRGLGERYSNVELNSLVLPSPDPTKRVVPLDVFPAGVIGSMKVQKSFTADVPGNFGGGYIDIRTKSGSAEEYVKFSVSSKMYDQTGEARYDYQGSGTDSLGKDDGYRQLPASVQSLVKVEVGETKPAFSYYSYPFWYTDENGNRVDNQDQYTQIIKEQAEREVNVNEKKTPVSNGGSFEFSKNFEIGSDRAVNLFANYSYSQDFNNIKENYYIYDQDSDDDSLYQIGSGYIGRYTSKYKQGGLLNLGYDVKDKYDIKFTKVYLLNSDKSTRILDGELGSNILPSRYYYLEWRERELDINQVSGNIYYNFFSDMTFSFGYENALANMNQPGDVLVKYEAVDGVTYKIKPAYDSNFVYTSITSDDVVDNYYLKNKANLDLFSDKDYVEVGFSTVKKTRESRTTKVNLQQQSGTYSIAQEDKVLTPDEILDIYVRNNDFNELNSTFQLAVIFNPSDYFDAELVENATYVNFLLNPFETTEVMIGARQVDMTQTLYAYEQDTENANKIKRVPYSLSYNKSLPSLSIKQTLNEDNLIKAGYAESYIYPDFREFSSNLYTHPETVADVYGNPDLKITDIQSIDLRYEHYFSMRENLNFALFFKYLKNPIEDAQEFSTSLPAYTYMNSDEATIQGFEIDGNKYFDWIHEDLENFYFSGNYAYIDSNVVLSEEKSKVLTSNNRPLQGLSPEIINISLGYDDSERTSFNFSYNKMADRLMKLGLKNELDGSASPDDYERPPQYLDFTWFYNFESGIKLSLKMGNMLDEKTVWYKKDTVTGKDQVTKEYKTGKTYALSLSYKY